MPRQNEAWDCWYEDNGVLPGKSQQRVKCRFCPHIMSYRDDSMLVHLGYRTLVGVARDVSTCRMVLHTLGSCLKNVGALCLNM